MPTLFLIKNRVAEWSSRLVETRRDHYISNIFSCFLDLKNSNLKERCRHLIHCPANQEYVFHTVTELRSLLLDNSVMLGIKNHKNDCQKELKRTFLGFGFIPC